MHRPWANGLTRLLGDRRLKKGDLAELASVRPGTISAVANSPKAPDVATLQKLANGFTRHDQKTNPLAPAVELWEFFVSDEQAAMLHSAAAAKAEATRQRDQDPALVLAKAISTNPGLAAAMMKLAETAATNAAHPAGESDTLPHTAHTAKRKKPA